MSKDSPVPLASSGKARRQRFRALLTKESVQVIRDPSTFLIAFVLPLLLLFLFGYAVSLDTARTRIGLSVQSSSGAANGLAQAFQNSRWFEVVKTGDAGELHEDLVAGKIRGFVVIPQDFSRQVARGRADATIQVVTDGSVPNTASFVGAYAEGIRATWAQGDADVSGVSRQPPITLNSRFWFNPELKSRYFLVPGSIAIVMTMIGTLLTALVVAREWERGTMEAMMATPITMVEFIASKIIPYFFLALGSMAICTLLAVYVFGVPFRGSPWALTAIISAFLAPALGQGLLISAATKNQFVASQIALLSAFLPSMLLSGFLFEIDSMPWPIQIISYLVPARYLIPSLQTVFLAGDLWSVFIPNMLITLGFGALFFLLTFRVTRKRLD